MSRLGYVKQVVEELGMSVGQSDLSLDDRGATVLQVEGMVFTLIHAADPEEILWLFVDLGQVPEDAELLRGLLTFGLMTWASAQMTVGVNKAGDRILGYVALPVVVLTAERLIDCLNRMHACGTELVGRLNRRDFSFDPGAP
ncbi:MAG: type III secretion system chaperone, partial [Pseudomonadota bacterium]